jgi:hypothetical protein
VKILSTACLTALLLPQLCFAQSPTGTIGGIVRDPSGGAIASARVDATSRDTGQVRTTETTETGQYSFPALPADDYTLTIAKDGFERAVRQATVEAGTTTRADFDLRIGTLSDSVAVTAASPQIHYEAGGVTGLVTHDDVERLPLNGRSFLELAKLEPGVQAPSATNRNRTLVPVLGAPASNVSGVRFTVDGGSISSVALGGAQMGLSQEVVQEFQVATVNADLSAGMTNAGAVNVVTRSGGNAREGTAFYFFRDHHLSAYPALNRDPQNPDPYFQRQQFGAALGGALRRDRVFYFASWERNDQQAVAATTLLSPDFAALSRITRTPLVGNLFSARVDARISPGTNLIVRYSHDGSTAFSPPPASGGGSPNAYPSNWNHLQNDADQALVGVTSVLRPSLINDLRVSFFSIKALTAGAESQDCGGCLGIGAPSITVQQVGLVLGKNSTSDTRDDRFEMNESLTWQRGAHRVRAGADWEHNRDRNFAWANDPASMTLFSPDQVRAYNAGVPPELKIPLPASFQTLNDILQLPLQSVTVGIGDPGVPQADGDVRRKWNTLSLFAEDTWRAHEKLTLTYGVGWSFDSGILNHDLSKPALLAPILGADGLGPTRNNWTNFSPVVSAAWMPSSDAKTVIHAAAGRYYGPQGLTNSMDVERAALGPPGLGRQNLGGSSILNPLPDIPGVPIGTPLNFTGNNLTLFTGADLVAILQDVRAGLAQSLSNGNPSLQAIQITKQALMAAIFPETVPDPSALHVNVGVQRELGHGVVVSADAVYRHFIHVPQNGGSFDANHFKSVREPAIPACNGAQANDPQALCSTGPIIVQEVPYRATHRVLVLRAEKRFSNGFQILGSYTYSHNVGTVAGNGFNLEEWLQNSGPIDPTHILNVAGVAELPLRFELGFNFSYSSAPPFSAYVGGMDFNGDGTGSNGANAGDLLPGTTPNAFNKGMGPSDLERLVNLFNQTYAGTKDPHGTLIPHLTLPAQYSLGDNFHSLDLRLSRSLMLGPHQPLTLMIEAFNVYNAANLTMYSGDLRSADTFGQPGNRVNQTFGSGGPRTFQLAARIAF